MYTNIDTELCNTTVMYVKAAQLHMHNYTIRGVSRKHSLVLDTWHFMYVIIFEIKLRLNYQVR